MDAPLPERAGAAVRPKPKPRRRRSAAALVVALAGAALLLVFAASANATSGTISGTGSCLNERTGPGTGYSVITCIPDGTAVGIACQTTGTTVTGPWGATNIWDYIDYGNRGGYVTDAYVYTGTNGFVAPYCHGNQAVVGNDYPYSCVDCVDPWNFYTRECTSFVAWRMNHQYGVSFTNTMGGGRWGNAENWDSNGRALGYTVDHVPTPGSIAQFDPGVGGASSLGHVALVASVGSGNVTIEEYNWSYLHGYDYRTISASTPSWYIHVAG
jgi:surface antigen